MEIKFFTDKSVLNPYLLIKIKDYLKIRDKDPTFFDKYKEVFVDPGVYELKKSDKYSWEDSLNIGEFLDSLPTNHYFSADYPCDMNIRYTAIFLDKSWTNALKYCYHKQYITTVQSQFNNYWMFTQWFDKYNVLYFKEGSQIMGLGNMCRFKRLNEYLKHTLDYAFSRTKFPRIHIYGLCLKAIPYAYKLAKKYTIELSIDSLKWTFGFYETEKEVCNNRDFIFNRYLNKIKEKGIVIE